MRYSRLDTMHSNSFVSSDMHDVERRQIRPLVNVMRSPLPGMRVVEMGHDPVLIIGPQSHHRTDR
jgi:hypothetical protein